MSISIVYFRGGREIAEETDRYFVASESPFYLGLMVKPSLSIWEILKTSSVMNVRTGAGDLLQFDIIYKIEVGENTVFFARPSEGYVEKAENVFL